MAVKEKSIEYLSVADIAHIYGIGVSTVWRWLKEKKFPAPVRIGKRWTRWRKFEVEEYIEKNSI